MADLNELIKKTRALIDAHGCSVISVFPDEVSGFPGFSYTVGLTEKGLPELILVGLHPAQAHPLLLLAAARQMEEGPLVGGNRYDWLLEGLDCAVIEVSETYLEEMPRMAHAVNRSENPVEALQLVWPDSKGRFPWESGYETKYSQLQRLLGPIH